MVYDICLDGLRGSGDIAKAFYDTHREEFWLEDHFGKTVKITRERLEGDMYHGHGFNRIEAEFLLVWYSRQFGVIYNFGSRSDYRPYEAPATPRNTKLLLLI